MKQNTIKDEISFSGVGLHSGLTTTILLKPAPENTGIIFKRTDIKRSLEVPALYSQVSNAVLGTTISNKNTECQTIEHLMAALWASGVDNIYIEYNNKETPIMDGSAISFINEIKKAGIQEQNANRKYVVIKKEIKIEDGKKMLVLTPHDDFKVDIEVEFSYGGIGKQTYSFDGNEETFIKEIAMARTFCNFTEIENMKKIGFARGGFADINLSTVKDSESKIPFFLKILSIFKKAPKQEEYDNLLQQFKEGKIVENAAVYDSEKILNKSGLRCENEVAKHKLLDLIGDFYTSGYHIKGQVNARWNGHAFHNKFLHYLFSNKDNYSIEE
jgi:UDP-3-O-[3-hydroxymyristoyl] N-acetylglucosamine deacetylase